MEKTEFIWFNGQLAKWDDATVHVLTHTLHYGAGAFEGIRVYPTKRGPAVFRLDEHIERLLYSAAVLKMKLPYSKKQLIDATLDTVRANKLSQGYIRPIAFYGSGIMGLNPKEAPIEVVIACWPWGAYHPHDAIDVKMSSYCRIDPRSTVADAKICGHYVNSILAVLELRDTHYHEALFLDGNGTVAEGPGENFFIVKDGIVITPPLGAILAGITRATIIQLARSLGLEVQERHIAPDELWQAQEAFFTGTAAEVTPIRSIDDRLIGSGGVGTITERIKSSYLRIVQGEDQNFDKFLSYF